VKLHRTSITRKLEVQSVAELTRLTEEAGLFKNNAPAPDAMKKIPKSAPNDR